MWDRNKFDGLKNLIFKIYRLNYYYLQDLGFK